MKIGLALGGGGARGLAHIGVLKVLEENCIKINYITGTSIGAIVAALYCSGFSIKELEKFALELKFPKLVDFSISKEGIIKGKRIEKLLRKLLKNKRFKDLKCNLTIIATDLETGELTEFSKGDVTNAIMASIAIPGLLPPRLIKGRLYVDGGVVDPLPVETLRKKKCDRIIAVDLYINYNEQQRYFHNEKNKSLMYKVLREKFVRSNLKLLKEAFKEKRFEKIPRFINSVIDKIIDRILTPRRVLRYITGRPLPDFAHTFIQSYTLLTTRLTDVIIEHCKVDILIRPRFKSISWIEFDKAKYIIKAGERATREKLSEIKRKVKK